MTHLPVGTLLALNGLYDLTASATTHRRACTSIVTEDAEGRISHGRNLDYPLASAMLNITYIVDWRHDAAGPVAFTSVGYLGQVGFNTAVRHGAFAVSQDERDVGPITSDWLEFFLRRRIMTFSFLRELAQSDASSTFEAAVVRAASVPLPAPSYFILSGVAAGEGAVVTRGREPPANASRADIVRLDAAAGRWYLLETNYDHGLPVDPHDDRRDVARRALSRVGQSGAASVDGLLAVLSENGHCNKTRGERPILNSDTVYTAAFSAALPGGGLQVVLRDPPAVDHCAE